jgi:hypothetical protein
MTRTGEGGIRVNMAVRLVRRSSFSHLFFHKFLVPTFSKVKLDFRVMPA